MEDPVKYIYVPVLCHSRYSVYALPTQKPLWVRRHKSSILKLIENLSQAIIRKSIQVLCPFVTKLILLAIVVLNCGPLPRSEVSDTRVHYGRSTQGPIGRGTMGMYILSVSGQE